MKDRFIAIGYALARDVLGGIADILEAIGRGVRYLTSKAGG